MIMGLILAENQTPAFSVPTETDFFSVVKIVIMIISLFIWAFPACWCSHDARRLQLNQFMWGLLIILSGLFGWFFWFLIPTYIVGMILFVLLTFGSILTYAIYRDSIVEEKDKILNSKNLWLTIIGKGYEEFKVEEKVKLATLEGREKPIPEGEAEQRVYQAVQDLIYDGLWKRAEEIYIQPVGEETRMLFKIDGVLSGYSRVDKEVGQNIVNHIKSLAELDVEEHRKPQKSTLVVQQIETGEKTEIDIETSGTATGERMIIKVRGEESRFTIKELGFTETQLKQMEDILNSPSGIVVISGMPNSGVSTTLYAIARSLDAFTQNIHTAEIKPLMELDSITQNVFDPSEHKSFATLIRSLARREADIILVDPCPDSETAAMMADIVSSRNRKIYTTLRASSANSALNRMIRWINSAELAGDVLLAVTFQRLVRKLCPACKEAYRPNPETLRKLNLPAKGNIIFYRPPTQLVDKKGNPIICPTCRGSGYLGRTAIFELIYITPEIKEAIKKGNMQVVSSIIKKSKWKPWEQAAIEKVIQGVTSIQEIVRVSKEPKERQQTK